MGEVDGGASRSWRLNSKLARGLRIMRAVRLIRAYKIIFMLASFMDHVQSQQLIIAIKSVCVLLSVLVCAHYVACYWYFITTLDDWLGLETDWVRAKDWKLAKVSDLYIASIHWSLAQSGFVSTTDTYPTNWLERGYGGGTTMFWLVLCVVLSTWCNVTAIQLRDLKIAFEKQDCELRAYLKEHSISGDLGNRLVRFFRTKHKELTVRKKESDIVHFNDLPLSFRIELHKEVYLPVLSKHLALIRLFDEDGLNSLCHLVMAEKHCDAGQSIFIEEQAASNMLYVLSGELSYYLRSRRTGCVKVEPDSWISEAVLWTPWKHAGCLISATSCEFVSFNVFKFHAVVAASALSPDRMDLLREYARLAVEKYSGPESTDLWSDLPGLERLALRAMSSAGFDCPDFPSRRATYVGRRLSTMAGVGVRQLSGGRLESVMRRVKTTEMPSWEGRNQQASRHGPTE